MVARGTEPSSRTPEMTIPRLVDLNADRHSRRAVVFPEEHLTYGALAELSRLRAANLRALGVRSGDHVGYLMANGVEIVSLQLAILRLGAVAVPINGRYKGAEIAYVVENADLVVLVVDDLYLDAATAALGPLATASDGSVDDPRFPRLRHVVGGSDDRSGVVSSVRFRAAAASPSEIAALEARTSADDLAFILYTSGTTARPKGAMHSQASLLTAAGGVAERVAAVPGDRWWSPLPLFHIAPTTVMLACFITGCTFVHVGFFDPAVAVAQLERERCTIAFPAFATMWLAVLDRAESTAADLAGLRCVMNIGVPESLRSMQIRVPWAVQLSGYGSTESGGFLSIGVPSDPLDKRVHTAGLPLEGMEVDVVDLDTGRRLGPGGRGELVYRGPSRLIDYYGAANLPAETIDDDGWFHSGDVFSLDPDLRMSFVERLKDMLRVGGENVAAAEIEDFLLQHRAVRIVQVVAAPDERYDEVACAFVELEPGAEATEAELIDFCRGRIASFKVPRYVRFVDDWPMSGTKIQKFELRAAIAAELAERGTTEAAASAEVPRRPLKQR